MAPRKHSMNFTDAPSKTKQAFAQGTRVDNVLRRYATLGVNMNDIGLHSSIAARMPFGLSPTFDYQAQLNAVLNVQNYFKGLPSPLRDRFKNDPATFLAYIRDPKNRKEAETLGLIEPQETPPSPGSPTYPTSATQAPSPTTAPPATNK